MKRFSRIIAEPNPKALRSAREREELTDQQHKSIHDRCLNLITLQASVARDARLIAGGLDAIVDLELIGDYAYEIASLCATAGRRPASQIVAKTVEVGASVQGALTASIDTWRTGGSTAGLDVRSQAPLIRSECASLYGKLSQLTATPGDTA